jgi:hypothetical protein
MYGIGEKETDDFGRQCLMARRLCENGVRFVQVTSGAAGGASNWDQHARLPEHEPQAKAVDKPIAGLLQDLKQRGLLEDTIVFMGSARTLPRAQAEKELKDAENGAGDVGRAKLRLEMAQYYEAARELARRLTEWSKKLSVSPVCQGWIWLLIWAFMRSR